MTIIDSGPLAALYLPTDQHHSRCVEAANQLSGPLLTTMPAFTEAMYFVGKQRGWAGHRRLWGLVENGSLDVRAFDRANLDQMKLLMERYADAPMDLADASIVALANSLDEATIFTLDRHFQAYRRRDRRAFQLVPGTRS